MDKEIWKDMLDYEGIYKISSYGRVWSIKRKMEMKYSPDSHGYMRIGLSKNKKCNHTSIHRLVAINFIPNPDNKPQVNHIDENKENNHISNLEWVTIKENINHGTRVERVARNNWKKVDRYNLNGEYVDSFNSINEAYTSLGYKDHSGISDCCRGKIKSSRGYIWKFAESK